MGVLASFSKARFKPVPALLAASPPKVNAFAETPLSKITAASALRVTVLFCNASRLLRFTRAPPVAPALKLVLPLKVLAPEDRQQMLHGGMQSPVVEKPKLPYIGGRIPDQIIKKPAFPKKPEEMAKLDFDYDSNDTGYAQYNEEEEHRHVKTKQQLNKARRNKDSVEIHRNREVNDPVSLVNLRFKVAKDSISLINNRNNQKDKALIYERINHETNYNDMVEIRKHLQLLKKKNKEEEILI